MKLNQIHIRDPFILLDNNKYYLYGSRGYEAWGKCTGLDVYVSDDLENWSSAHECFTPPDDFWSDMQFWAPEVHKYKEKYYMFVSFRSETRERGTQILVSDYPMGPFKVHSDGPVTPLEWRCLDGTLYIDKKERPYMIFCHEYAQIKDGTICALALTDDLKESIGEPIELFKASSCSKITGLNGEGNYVTDGPFMYRAKSGKLIMLACAGLMKNYGEYEDFDDVQRALDKCVALQEIKETLDSDCFWEKLIEHDNLLELGMQEMNYWLAKPASSVVFPERNEVYSVEELIDKIEVAIEELNSTYEPVEFEKEKLFFDDSLLVTVIYDESDVMYDPTKPLPQRKLGNAVTGNDPRTNRYVLFGSKNGINRKVIAMFRVDIPEINESPLHEVTLNMSAYRLSKDYNVDIYVADDFVDSENPNMSAVNDVGETLDKTSLGYMYFPFYPNLEQRTLNLTDYVKSLHEAGKETLCISVYANAPGAITSPSDGLHLWMENNPDTPHDDRPYVEVSYETKPTVKNVKIDGAVAVNEKLKASYDYYGIYPEGNSRIQWFKADDALGTNETLISVEKEIIVGTELVGKYIRCGIIPVSSGGDAGDGYIAYSNYAGAVTSVPVAQGIISNINTIDNRDDLSNYLANNNNVLLIDLEMKGISVELKNNVFDGIIARDFTTLGEFRKYVDQMVNVQFLNTAVDEAAILSLIQTADFGINSETRARYDTYQDKSFVNSRLLNKGFTSPESAKAAFEESCCLYEFSSISFDNVTDRLLAYDYLFGNKVKELSGNQEKLTLAGNMYISNTVNGVATFSDIKTAVINAVNGAINYQPSLDVPEGGTVGGGSSGGGFGGGIGSVAIGKTESPSVAPTPVEIKAFKDIDVVENWAGKAITELYKQGVINGVGEGKFEPNRVLYREEFVKMMVEAFDINVETKINFTDVDEDDWCYSYIERAVASGIIQGVDETSFGTGTPLSRQDLSVIIYRWV